MSKKNPVHGQQASLEARLSNIIETGSIAPQITSKHEAEMEAAQQAAIDAQAFVSGLSGRPAVDALRQVLMCLGWRGEERYLIEALPHFDEVHDMAEFRAVLARLNFETKIKKINPVYLGGDFLPALSTPDGKKIEVILSREGDHLKIFDADQQSIKLVEATTVQGDIYLITPVDLDERQMQISRYGWMGVLTRKFRWLFVQLLGLTFITNFFALAVPVYVMTVYDKVIGASSTEMLTYFFIGIAAVLGADMGLRLIRARILAYLGTRFDALLEPAAFQQILHLPISLTESVPIGAQISRLKQFESMREVFTGAIANAFLDLPFLVVFLTAIVFFGGAVAWVPVSLMVVYAIMAAITIPMTKKHVAIAGDFRTRAQNFLVQITTKHSTLREAHAQDVMAEQYRKIASDAVLGQFRSQQFTQIVQTLAQSFVVIAGVATLGIGSLYVMSGDMTLGALIAVMAMVWRVLNPIQAIFLSMNRLSQVVSSFRQVNHLMRLKLEREPGILPSFYRDFKGAIGLNRVSFRHNPQNEPALMGFELDIPPGQIVAIAGPNGAGKSTLLKVIAGLYAPQAGSIHLDGLDIRQIDVGELRHAIAYVPQEATFFYGTVEQNIHLAHPEATPDAVARAVDEARLYDYADLLPEGLQTRLTNDVQKRMTDSFKQRLMLARAYAKQAPVYLMDEPANGLDQAGDQAFCQKLESLRGNATVLMVTHRPSHMKMCDRVLYLDSGQLIHDGRPEQVLPLIGQAAA